MLTKRLHNERGQTKTQWLKSMHSFSFGDYYNSNRIRFGALRVLNEDYINPGSGFATHSHRNMEIITYVLEGKLAHKDSMGNSSLMMPCDIQLLSAGSGITHSEYNASDSKEVHLLQIWIIPNISNEPPTYQQMSVAKERGQNTFNVIISPDGEDNSLVIKQDVRLLIGKFDKGYKNVFKINFGHKFWLQLVEGQVHVNDKALFTGDSLAIHQEDSLDVVAKENAKILLFDLD